MIEHRAAQRLKPAKVALPFQAEHRDRASQRCHRAPVAGSPTDPFDIGATIGMIEKNSASAASAPSSLRMAIFEPSAST
jgi:hypothetical protein